MVIFLGDFMEIRRDLMRITRIYTMECNLTRELFLISIWSSAPFRAGKAPILTPRPGDFPANVNPRFFAPLNHGLFRGYSSNSH